MRDYVLGRRDPLCVFDMVVNEISVVCFGRKNSFALGRDFVKRSKG